MPFKLVCVHPFHDRVSGRTFERGDEVAVQDDVERLSDDREHHFVRVAISEEDATAASPPSESKPAA